MLFYEAKEPVVVRRTEDWGSLTHQDYRYLASTKFTHLGESYLQQLLTNLDVWQEYMSMSYPAYRAGLTRIARQSWEATRLKIVHHYDPAQTPMYPTDDDDWFHPSIRRESIGSFADPDVSVVIWRSWCCFAVSSHVIYEGNTFQMTFKEKSVVGNGVPSSNSYAVRMDTPRIVTFDHGKVRKHHLPYGKKIVYLDKPLSVWLLSPASLYNLLHEPFKPLSVGFLKRASVPEELEWCRPYYEQLLELNERAKPKRAACF